MKRLQESNPNSVAYWDHRYATEAEPMWKIWTTGDLIERLAAHIPNRARVLDVGAGAGIVPTRISKLRSDLRWSACDFSRESVDYLRKLGTVEFERLEVANVCQGLPFKPRSFDVVLATEILEHLDSPTAAIAEMARIASKRLLVSVPHNHHIPCHEHIWEFSEDDLKKLLNGYGKIEIEQARGGRNLIGVCSWSA